MFDRRLRPLIDPPLDALGRRLAGWGVSADAVTALGFGVGMAALPALAAQAYGLALGAIALNRLADGIDGAVARASRSTDFGGYLDIVLDMLFYGAIAFGFALADPDRNAIPAAFLLFGFMGTSASFLAFSALAAKRGLSTEDQGKKGIYYLAGLMEGGETIAFFIAMCLLPHGFPVLAWLFGALCLLTTLGRLVVARGLLRH